MIMILVYKMQELVSFYGENNYTLKRLLQPIIIKIGNNFRTKALSRIFMVDFHHFLRKKSIEFQWSVNKILEMSTDSGPHELLYEVVL
jgi:hypothetical protein